jgi:hypothetical protein
MTFASRSLVLAALAFAASCSGSKDEPAPATSAARSAAALTKPGTAEPPPEAAAPAVKAAPPVSATALPPLKVVQGDGITITEIVDGSVNLKTTTLWNEAFDTTYQTCDYYRGAIPVLKRQIAKERAKLLDQACVKDKTKKKK